MRLSRPVLVTVLSLALFGTSPAKADRAGDFDYYVLSLSWAPSWCATARDTSDTTSCVPGRKTGFTVHGLWPQHEDGWPADCATNQPNPSRRETAQMVDIMGSSGLAWYQWRKHGRCSGLSGRDYMKLTRRAAEAVAVPDLFSRLSRDVSLPANVVEDAFIEANPKLSRNAITVTCDGPALQEVRICLTRDLEPRDCAPDSRRDCRRSMVMEAPR